MAWDVMVPGTYAEYHLANKATEPGAATSTHSFCAVAIETASTCHDMAIELIQEVGKHRKHHSCSHACL